MLDYKPKKSPPLKSIRMKLLFGLKSLLTRYQKLWNSNLTESTATIETIGSNPYLAARHEWNSMFGDQIKAKQNWQRIAFITLITNIILICGLISLIGESRYIPYAVKVDSLGNSSFAGFLTREANISTPELNAFIRRWISNTRSVIADPIAEKQALDFVYACSTSSTAKVLNSFYQQNNPFKTAQQATIEVQVNTVLQKSDTTWQVDWTEMQRDTDGKIVGQSHWEALITIGQHLVSNDELLNINPLALFVEHISWAQQF